jgi:hypothetical protein
MNGFGVYLYGDGSNRKYQGNWKNSKKHGQGKEFFVDGSVYQGAFFHGKKHGKGTYNWPHKSKYEGDFYNDNMHGKGVYTDCEGFKTENRWRKNKIVNFFDLLDMEMSSIEEAINSSDDLDDP